MALRVDELRIVKLGYSSKPWRIVTPEGLELSRWEEYPGGGFAPIQAPLCFDRKRDAQAALDLMAMPDSPIGKYVNEEDGEKFDRLLTDPFGRDGWS